MTSLGRVTRAGCLQGNSCKHGSLKKNIMPNWSCDTTGYKEVIPTGQATTGRPHCRTCNCSMDLGGSEECSRMQV